MMNRDSENVVYERDYSHLPPLHLTTEFQQELAILKHAVDSGMIREYEDTVRAMPKYIVPSKRAAYDDMVTRLDGFAEEARGTICAVIDYEEWQASISLVLSVLRFVEPHGSLLLAEIALTADSITVTSLDNGFVQIEIILPYFEEIGNKEEIMDSLIEQDEKMLDMITRFLREQSDNID